MLVRPVRMEDHDAVLELAKLAGFGMTSLPPDPEVLLDKILRAVKSFDGKPDAPQAENFLFVLEDTAEQFIAGTCGIVAHVGIRRPFYSYKLLTITQASEPLSIFTKHTMLHVVNDLTGSTEIGSLFLHPEYRRDRLGRVLSRCRFLFLAEFPEMFSDQVISEIRGVHDSEGNSPFYDGLARHFFQMEFRKADYINATQGNQFITDLMPHHPIYASLLPKEAQAVIGKPYAASEAAMAMLEKEGFRYQGYLDVFDGGPTMIAERERLKTVRDSKVAQITEIAEHLEAEKHLISNRRFKEFGVTVGRLKELAAGQVAITQKAASKLGVKAGDSLRYTNH